MKDYALVLNAGSSSLKFCVYHKPDDQDWRLTSRGQIEGIGTSSTIVAKDAEGRSLVNRKFENEVRDSSGALEALARWLRAQYAPAHIVGVGHRVVHGGARFAGPAIVEQLDATTVVPPGR